ncbi:MAG: hypothetical protein FGM46_01830 [Ferruginibacter sp.]|nr:hypothetical protein [Ferruginibacter sp.]
MNSKNIYLVLLAVLILSSCSISGYLPAGEKLYRGADITINKSKDIKESTGAIKSAIKLATRPSRNKFVFGYPYKVWFWYVLGEPKKEKGLRSFLRRKLGEEPVLSSRINPTASAENIESLLQNLGYFHTKAKGDTIQTKNYIQSVYTIDLMPQYTLNDIVWYNDSSHLMRLVEQDAKNSLLKKGNPYRLSDISLERERVDQFLKTKGYYFFNPDYLMAYADSTIGDHKVNLLLYLKRVTPEEAKKVYQINSITVYPNHSLSATSADSMANKPVDYEGIKIYNNGFYKNQLFANTITYRADTTYSSELQNNTLNRLISLGAFKFVKNKFDVVKDSSSANKLDVTYYLTPNKLKTAQVALDGFVKDNNFLGTKLGVTWKNRNVFRGAEQLGVRLYGAYETSLVDSLSGNNNLRIGSEVSLSFPIYVIPFFKIRENNFYPANTAITFSYEWYRKRQFYTKQFFRLQYEFIRKTDEQTQFNFAPVSVIYTNTSSVTDNFLAELANNPSLAANTFPEAVIGSFFSYSRHSPYNEIKNRWYLSGSVDLSGNLAGVLLGAKEYRSKTVLNVPFAQFVKFDFDVHYTRQLFKKTDWANRLQLGIGIPYNNSRVLPFAKLYTIGGSTSIRGFNARGLGPGTVKNNALDQNIYQLIGGDYRLLFNSELRLPINNYLSGALFFDAGNTWTKDTILFGPEGKLTGNFMKEIAVAAGAGIRLDATVILIRFDFGVPLRKPFLPDGERWVIHKINPGSRSWRRENLILNIGIGLPF